MQQLFPRPGNLIEQTWLYGGVTALRIQCPGRHRLAVQPFVGMSIHQSALLQVYKLLLCLDVVSYSISEYELRLEGKVGQVVCC